MNVHLVDGTYELFRAYYGPPPRKSPTGMEVGATVGLLRSLYALLRSDGVTHVACAFDTVVESFRNQLFDGYKTGEGIDPDLMAQFPLAERASAALGLVTWRMREFEADDAMATAAARFAEDPRVERVYLCSPDKDLCQAVTGDKVVSLDRKKDVVTDEPGVEERFGVAPASIPDYLALVGDSADGIPGLPGWGAKSTSTVLARYGRLEDIPPAPDDWEVKVRGAARLGAVLREDQDAALLYRRLATLRTDVPLEESLDDLRWRGARRDLMESLAAELGETRLLERIDADGAWS